MAVMNWGSPSLITLVFGGERAHPAVAEVLSEIAAGRDIGLLDLVFVARAADGSVRVAAGRQDLEEAGLGSVMTGAQALVSEGDVRSVSDSLQPGASAAVIAYEHSWARRLASAAEKAGAAIIADQPGEQQQAGASLREKAESESDAAVREAEAEAAAAAAAAERYSTLAPPRSSGDSLTSQLAELARLRDAGAISQAEFEAAKARLLAT